MKLLRLIIVVFSLIVFVVFGIYRYREYVTSDYVAPVISADTDTLLVSVNATDADILAGMSARDNLDGDVSNTLFVVSKSKFLHDVTRRVDYAAFDKDNNVGTYSREITYTDYVSPHFSLVQPLHFLNSYSSHDYLKNFRAYDCLDGNLTQQLRITLGETTVIDEMVSSRKINLQVTNSAGDTATLALDALLEDYDTFYKQSPALSEYLIYTNLGEKPDYSALIDGILSGDRSKEFRDTKFDPSTDISINDAAVDYYTPGVYSVNYHLSQKLKDGTREALGTTVLFVIVEG